MDSLQLRSYLAIRSIERFPEAYHNQAKELLENLPEREEEQEQAQSEIVKEKLTEENATPDIQDL